MLMYRFNDFMSGSSASWRLHVLLHGYMHSDRPNGGADPQLCLAWLVEGLLSGTLNPKPLQDNPLADVA